jgi:hypothetical protein
MTGRNAYDSGASAEVQGTIKSLSGQIQAQIEQHKANVKAMRADATMTKVMEEYDGVEARFNKAAAEVQNIIKLLGDTLQEYDTAADNAFKAASQAVQGIGNT